MKRTSLMLPTFVMALALFATSQGICKAQIEEVHNVTVRGTDYQVTQLMAVRRDHINPLNALRLKRGQKFHLYRTLDGGSDYPLKLYEPEFEKVKSNLKDVPDYRTFEEKHPYVLPTINTVNGILSLLSWFI